MRTSVSFSSLPAAEAIMLFFLFLFILVHSILKNGERRDERYVKVWFASSSTLRGNKHIGKSGHLSLLRGAPHLGLVLGSPASRTLKTNRGNRSKFSCGHLLGDPSTAGSVLHVPEYVLVRYKMELFQSWDMYKSKSLVGNESRRALPCWLKRSRSASPLSRLTSAVVHVNKTQVSMVFLELLSSNSGISWKCGVG